jgi:prepilin peptidase CpaA
MIGPWILVVLPLLAVATISDCRHRLIPNWVSLGLVLAFVPYGLLHLESTAFLLAIMAAGLLFLLASIPFHVGWLGGGDVKLLAAGALWTGWDGLLDLLILTTLVGGLIALGMLAGRLAARLRARGRTGAEHMASVPYGVAISAAIVWTTLTAHTGGW